MFRKILLSYFPSEESNNKLSPIAFHLRLLSPKLFYGISCKHSLDNRRAIGIDLKFSYFLNNDINFNNFNDENSFYSYKILASLNGYNNYNIYTILPVITLISIHHFYDSFKTDLNIPKQNLNNYLNPLLYGINYLVLMFFGRFKEYENNNEKENIAFMLKMLEKTILHLEITKQNNQNIKKIEEFTKNIINIIKLNSEFVIFLYKTTKQVNKIYEGKSFTDILLYEYLSSAMLLDSANEQEIKKLIKITSKRIYINRFSYYLDSDITTLLNIIAGDTSYINYITNNNNINFLDYFAKSLKHIENIDISENIVNIVDKVLDFKKWGPQFLEQLKNFNTEYIDIVVEPGMQMEDIKELMSKEMMDNVKKVSSINEQFLDYYIMLISKLLNNQSYNYQFEFKNNYFFNKKFSKIERKEDIISIYKILDKQYFIESIFFKSKHRLRNTISYYDFSSKIVVNESINMAIKALLSDFNKKSHIEYINSSKYMDILRKNFQKNIGKLIKGDVNKLYIKKFFSKLTDFKASSLDIKEFKKNIYYPDFIVFYDFLLQFNNKISANQAITFSRIKESLFGYIILQNIVGYDEKIEELYLLSLGLYSSIDFNVKSFYTYFTKSYPDFVQFFSNVKQNKTFSKLVVEMYKRENIKLKSFFLYDNLKDINYYNKRLFKL